MPSIEGRSVGHSLWLVPEGEAYRTLRELVGRLSREHGTPDFEPHVTLLGRITGDPGTAAARASTLADTLAPLVVRLGPAELCDEYFRSLYFEAERSEALLEAGRRARAVFGREADSLFLPHLSLLYGRVPEPTKRRIATEVERYTGFEFPVRSLHLVSTHGAPEEWRRVEEFALGRPAGG